MSAEELQESVIHINRVAKVVKGGRNFAFTALVAVGDGNGNAGIGYGKGSEVPLAIQKAIENAKKNIHVIPMAGNTIVHSIIGEHGSSRVLLKPAAPGTGVIAGGAARQVLEAAGVKDILAKSLGSPTHLNVAKATLNGLLNQRTPDSVAALRGKNVSEVAPKGLIDAYEKTKSERKIKVNDGES
tara:strand:- start:1855 stop:2409 length:555 start_codon:yes stop_codon:yes gene_type:complete